MKGDGTTADPLRLLSAALIEKNDATTKKNFNILIIYITIILFFYYVFLIIKLTLKKYNH